MVSDDIIGFTRAMAAEVGRQSIRVNVIVPGYIETDMTAGTYLIKFNYFIIPLLLRLGVSACFAPFLDLGLKSNIQQP